MAAADRKSYECDAPNEARRHWVQTGPNYRALAGTKCLGYWQGSPCPGTLWRIGDGSIKENKAARARAAKEGAT